MSVSILVVDDETDVAELFRQHFRREARQGTYVLHFAYSGEEALDKLAAGIEPQLIVILSDINMPVMEPMPVASRAAAVSTASTPGAAWADAVSMPRMSANACGERTNTPQAAPAVASSSWKLPAPVRSR